jgi:hypothetical protein
MAATCSLRGRKDNVIACHNAALNCGIRYRTDPFQLGLAPDQSRLGSRQIRSVERGGIPERTHSQHHQMILLRRVPELLPATGRSATPSFPAITQRCCRNTARIGAFWNCWAGSNSRSSTSCVIQTLRISRAGDTSLSQAGTIQNSRRLCEQVKRSSRLTGFSTSHSAWNCLVKP